jgi:sugar phosphate isomerase/epimerase
MSITRRNFLGAAAATTASLAVGQTKKIPIGLELYSVRMALAADPVGTVKKVAGMGYEVVEFFSPYYAWTLDQAKDMRKALDDLGIRCNSTHNNLPAFQPANYQKTIDLNHAIGAKYVVLASSSRTTAPDYWKKLGAETLTPALDKFRAAGLLAGYHNHQYEFVPTDNNGPRAVEILAANTPKDFMMQFDVGTAVEMGNDPIAWVNGNPGRIHSMHLKDWNKEQGYKVLFGEGAVQWKPLLEAAIQTGGAEYFLIEQEGSRYPEFETAQRCLDNYKKLMA